MKAIKTERGFVWVWHEAYGSNPRLEQLIGESSAIGNYGDSMSRPGSSFLWVGYRHHLNREEIEELIGRLQHWLDTGRLDVENP